MIIAPSLFAANSGKLIEEIEDIERGGARYLHIDIMDANFVPNLSFGPNIVRDIRSGSEMTFDVHLMVQYPLLLCETFIKAGADIITVHREIEGDISKIYEVCAAHGVGFGLSICPDTPLESIKEYADLLDILLVMGINPGFGGQKFMPKTLQRIQEAAVLRENIGADYLISVDGGVNEDNACDIGAAGVDILVAGTAIFGKEDRKEAMENILGNTSPKRGGDGS